MAIFICLLSITLYHNGKNTIKYRLQTIELSALYNGGIVVVYWYGGGSEPKQKEREREREQSVGGTVTTSGQ